MDSVTKVCRICKREKPITEYYKHSVSRGGYANQCKECAREIQRKNYKIKPDIKSVVSGRDDENVVIKHLKTRGIYAVAGKSTAFKWADVVAWGCVTIEVKTSKSKYGKHQFSFSPKQWSGAHKTDFILLVLENNTTFSLFPYNHPVFLNDDGTRKHGIGYVEGDITHKNIQNQSLTDALFEYYRDAWEQIEEKRIEISKNLVTESINV